MKRFAIMAGLTVFAGLMLSIAATAQSGSQTVSIQSNFNGTPIPAGSFIWINTHMTPTGLSSTQATTFFVHGGVNINGLLFPLPNATITYDPNPPAPFVATTTWNSATTSWETRIPGGAQTAFMTGFAYPFPAGLAGGQNPVTVTLTFSSNAPHVSGSWQWGAAVYTQAPSDPNQLGVLPIEMNGRHAGTPVNIEYFVIGGARGGGGSNFTGSWSATGHFDITGGATPTPTPTPTTTPTTTPTPPFVTPTPPTTTPEPTTIVLFGSGLAALGGAAFRRFWVSKRGTKDATDNDDTEN